MKHLLHIKCLNTCIRSKLTQCVHFNFNVAQSLDLRKLQSISDDTRLKLRTVFVTREKHGKVCCCYVTTRSSEPEHFDMIIG